MYVEYSSNNSGGNWWLNDEDWKALEAAGWEVDWVANWDKKGRISAPMRMGDGLARSPRTPSGTACRFAKRWQSGSA